MAFHRGRGGARGRRGVVSASSSRGRGRGRGRGGVRSVRGKSTFSSARIADEDQSIGVHGEDTDSSQKDDDEEESAMSGDSSGDDDNGQEASSTRPYTMLLQNLSADSGSNAKRRKIYDLSTQTKSVNVPVDDKVEETDLDKVEEPEEGPETAIEDAIEEEGDDSGDITDPFEAHFANPDNNVLQRRLKALQRRQWLTQKTSVTQVGKAVISIPGDGKTAVEQPPPLHSPNELRLKQRLAEPAMMQKPVFDDLERAIAPIIFSYQDLLYCERTAANSQSLRRLTCLHVINHVFKTRDKVIKNNARLAREEHNDDLDLRDQGFCRPKVLMLLPTRESCVRMVDMIISLCTPEQQENRKRFEESYVEREDNPSTDKAEDFRELFSGNDDDMFRLGMKFTRKTVKFFSQFYNSDIIFASPLGLRMALGSEEDKSVDYDFLSSIEVVVVDQANALLMQNWEHVEFIFDNLNLQPKQAHGCDFGRVREWYLDNNAKFFRQTIALSAFNTPEMNTLFYNQSQNWEGKIKITQNSPGTLQNLGLKIKQTFSRFDCTTPGSDPDARFSYFTTAVIPTLTRHTKDSSGTLIFVPSYLDFVRVRNYFSTSNTTSALSFASISEYTSVRDVARARSHFLTGRHKVLLYTERAHHFRRYQIRGVKKVVMYGLPDNPIFYAEIVGGNLRRSLQEGKLEPGEGSVRVIFSKWDFLKLERIAGAERVGKMIKDKGDIFDFV